MPKNIFKGSQRTIIPWINEVIAYFDKRTTSGVVEGINNKLKLIQRSAYGFRNNAIKYSPQGGTVRFSCIGKTDQLTFRIPDEGLGIPSEDLPQLMQSFYRATNAGTIPGKGLGLAIVKKCVELHGGQITVDSQLGVGTTFKITLPLNRSINPMDTTQG